ncbi:MAG TPA: phosphotransferase [Cyanophyceae cyanobacterium]
MTGLLKYFCHDGLLVTLFPLMMGRVLDRENEAECISAAKMLARLHNAGLEYPDVSPRPSYPPLRELDWDNNRIWRWVEVENLLFNQSEKFLEGVSDPEKRFCTQQIFAKRTEIAREREVFRDWVAALTASGRSLVSAPIQGDYWRNNLLVKEGQISAVLDWDECQTEWLVYELGRATWEFCKDRRQHTLNHQKTMRFLQAYQEAGGAVPSTNFDLLIPLIRCVRVIEVLFALQQASHLGLDEHVLHNLLSLESLRNVELVL